MSIFKEWSLRHDDDSECFTPTLQSLGHSLLWDAS